MAPALLAALAPHLTLCSDGDPDPAVAEPVMRAVARVDQAASQTVRIIVTAQRGIAHAVRSAVIRIGASSNGRGWRSLAWGAALANRDWE